MGPFEVVGPVGESGEPFPELHAADKISSGQATTARKRCFIPLCIGPVQELRPDPAPRITRTKPMTNPARPWTRFYHPSTPSDLGPPKYPHMAAAIRESSATFAKKPAFTLGLPNGSQGGMTFEEPDRLSDELAVYLREVAGFKAGDRVAIQMPNCLPYPIAVFGILKAGLVMVTTHSLYPAAGMVLKLPDSGDVGMIGFALA